MPLSRPKRVSGFRKAIATRLKPLTPRLAKVLSPLITHDYPDDFWQLDFEIHEFDDRFPIVAYFYFEGFEQIMEEDKRAKQFPFKAANALRRVGQVYPAALERRFRINDDEYWFEDVAAKELIPWFHRCWLKAGGKSFPFRARLAAHDTAKRLDLVKGKWTRNS